MPDYLVKPLDALAGWAVCCDGSTVSSHFSQGSAVADALRRAGVGGRVSLQDGGGCVVDLPRFGASPEPAGTA